MKHRMRRGLIAAAAALGVVLCGAAGAGARVLVKSDFAAGGSGIERNGGRDVQYERGLGWSATHGGDSDESAGYLSVDLRKAGVSADEGTLDFIVKRGETADVETLFALFDDGGAQILGGDIFWKGHLLGSAPEIVIPGSGFGTFRPATKAGAPAVRASAVKLSIAPGEVFRLTITWGAAGSAMYLNGALVSSAEPGAAGFGAAIGKAARMDVGASRAVEPPLFNSQMTSVVGEVVLLDVATLERLAAPSIVAVSHDASRVASFSGKLVAGDVVTVALEGSAGHQGSFDVLRVADFRGEIGVSWRGWGVYLEEKTFFDEGEVDLKTIEGYRVYARRDPLGSIDLATPFDQELPADVQSVVVTLLDPGAPYYVAVMAVTRDGRLLPVVEPKARIALRPVDGSSGEYQGSFTVGYGDVYPEAVVLARLGDGADAVTMAAPGAFEIDARLNVGVAVTPQELKADESSTAKVVVTVTDANGKAVGGHKVKFLLATTSQYTGVVGGGKVVGGTAFSQQVGGVIRESVWAETDIFGQVTTSYTAGFAAKTAIIVARDMASNDTGAGWVKTYIESAAQLELEPAAPGPLAAAGYEIEVTSSDAWLTADGSSKARITARVTLNGAPVEGHRIVFSASAGSVRVVSDRTDRNGLARAVYTAGTKIGVALVTATDVDVDLSGSVPIELRSDAPAKISIRVDPGRLPADGRSAARVVVRVTDVNDNPNEDTEVEYVIQEGSGSLRDEKTLTDRDGESSTEYRAGRDPGRVTIGVTVRSTVPSDEEITAARGLAVAVQDGAFF